MTEIPNQSFRMPASDASKYLEQASALMKIGKYQEAIPLYESALATLERIHGPEQPEIAECLQELGEAYEAGQRLGDALVIHTRLLRMGEKFLGRTNPNVVAMLLKLSQICEMLGQQADALSYCQQSLEAAKQCLAQDDPLSEHIVERFNYLASIAQTQVPAPPQEIATDQSQPAHWSEDVQSETPANQVRMPTSMQDFAREMLQDMPDSQRGFGQPVNSFSGTATYAGDSSSYNSSLNAVAPPQFANQKNDYKAILEAGFSAAQSHTSQTSVPSVPSSGNSGNGLSYPGAGAFLNTHTSPSSQTNAEHSPPNYSQTQGYGQPQAQANGQPQTPADRGSEVYSLQQLDDIRYGRRESSEMPVPSKPTRGRRISSEDDQAIRIRRLAQSFALPAFAVIVVLGVILLVAFGHKDAAPNPVPVASEAGAPIYGRFDSTEGDKEVRLVSGSEAVMVNGNSAVQLPYARITNGWGDLFSAMTSSITQKQIWAEKKDYGIRTQDDVIYYASDGAEAKVVAKMRHLAGYVQAYLQKKGEYPKYVVGTMAGEFAFVNPIDGRGSPVTIKILASQDVDGADARAGLESGLEIGLLPNSGTEASMLGNPPCSITCYAVVVGKADENADKLRATKFFVRGCDRNGTFLASGHPGRTYVVPASDTYLAAIPAASIGEFTVKPAGPPHGKGASKAKPKNKSKSQKAQTDSSAADTNDDSQVKARASKPAPSMEIDKPPKNTKIWMIENPAFPMVLMHHSLPLLLLIIAGLAYLQSRVVHVEATGASISETSNVKSHYAKIAAAVFLGLAFLTIFIQLVVFG